MNKPSDHYIQTLKTLIMESDTEIGMSFLTFVNILARKYECYDNYELAKALEDEYSKTHEK